MNAEELLKLANRVDPAPAGLTSTSNVLQPKDRVSKNLYNSGFTDQQVDSVLSKNTAHDASALIQSIRVENAKKQRS